MKKFKFKSEEDAKDKLAKVFYKYQIEGDEVELILKANQRINLYMLKKLLEKKLKEVMNEKSAGLPEYQQDKNEGWEEALEWLIEQCE